MIDLYKGTLGLLYDIDELKTKILKYIIMQSEPLNYEIKEFTDKVKVVCITGKNEHEKSFKNFNHPIIIDNHDALYVVGDFRLFMKSNLNDLVNITDYFKDRYNGMLQMRRLILTKMMLENRFSLFDSITYNVSEIFASLISTIYNVLVLDKTITSTAYFISHLHFYLMDLEEDIKLEDAIEYLPMSVSKRLISGADKDIFELMKHHREDLILPSKTAEELIKNIQIVDRSGRLKNIILDTLIQSLSRTFYAFETKEMSLAFLENKPTIYSIIYSVITEGINSRSTLRKVIEGKKIFTKPKHIREVMEKVLNDEIARF